MKSPYLTAFEAACYLNVPLSTFYNKAKLNREKGGWGLVPVHLFPGPRGIRYRWSDIKAIVRRAEENRNREIARTRKVVEKAGGRTLSRRTK